MEARLYRPAKNAMQSGRAIGKAWVMEYAPVAPRTRDPLTGWTSAEDTLGQVKMTFANKESALAFAESRGIAVSVGEIKFGFRDEAEEATVNGRVSDVLTTTTTDLGSAITKGDFEWGKGTNTQMKGLFILPAEAKGTLHLFYTTRQQHDYQFQEFKFDLGEWEFDAK